MIKAACFFLIGLLVAFSLSGAFADSGIIEAQCPSDFFVQNIAQSDDGTFLLAGSTGRPRKYSPLIMRIGLDGKALWSIKGKKTSPSELYRDAKSFEDGSIVAISIRDHKCIVELIKDDKVVWKSKPMENGFDVYPISKGFLVYSKPDYNSLRIRSVSMDGDDLWRIDLEEPIKLTGILTGDGVYVAFGDKVIREKDHERDPTSVIFAFDDQGSVLWRHDSTANEVYKAAAWTDRGHVVLAGDIPAVAEGKDVIRFVSKARSFVAEYDANGCVWRTDLPYMDGEAEVEEWVASVLPVEGGYLVSAEVSGLSATVRMFFVDQKGVVQKEWDESTGALYSPDTISLHAVGQTAYLLSSGNVKPENPGDFGDGYVEVPYKTILKEIRIPG